MNWVVRIHLLVEEDIMGLLKALGGKDIPGVGWAGGIERIMLLMKDVPTKAKQKFI